tara:strand:- start:4699 stop:4989 length:291 start_codon:yes stop_codon:yes gene_type:complete
MNVKLIRMSSGEDVVATIVDETDSVLKIEDAIVAIPTGEGKLGFAPWSPIVSRSDKILPVNKNFVVYVAEVAEDIVNQYNQMFSKIVTPANKLIVK